MIFFLVLPLFFTLVQSATLGLPSLANNRILSPRTSFWRFAEMNPSNVGSFFDKLHVNSTRRNNLLDSLLSEAIDRNNSAVFDELLTERLKSPLRDNIPLGSLLNKAVGSENAIILESMHRVTGLYRKDVLQSIQKATQIARKHPNRRPLVESLMKYVYDNEMHTDETFGWDLVRIFITEEVDIFPMFLLPDMPAEPVWGAWKQSILSSQYHKTIQIQSYIELRELHEDTAVTKHYLEHVAKKAEFSQLLDLLDFKEYTKDMLLDAVVLLRLKATEESLARAGVLVRVLTKRFGGRYGAYWVSTTERVENAKAKKWFGRG